MKIVAGTADTPQNHKSNIEKPILISDEFNNKTAYKCNQYNKKRNYSSY